MIGLNKMSFKIFFMSGNPGLSDVKPGQSLGLVLVFFFTSLLSFCVSFLPHFPFFCLLCICYISVSFLWFLFPLGNLVSHMQSKGLSTQGIRLLDILTWHEEQAARDCACNSQLKIMWEERTKNKERRCELYNWWHSSWRASWEKYMTREVNNGRNINADQIIYLPCRIWVRWSVTHH